MHNEERVGVTALSRRFGINENVVKLLIRRYDYHGDRIYDNTYNFVSKEIKLEIFQKVNDGCSITQLMVEYLVTGIQIHKWLKDYEELDKLIYEYEICGNAIFVDFARLLKRYREPIIDSFQVYQLENGESVRLSNGRMEGFNRFPKDMKRDARGFEVFDYIKGRLIYANRKNVPIKGVPKTKEEISRSKKKYRQNKKK